MSNIIMIESKSESDSNYNGMYFPVLYNLANMKTQSYIVPWHNVFALV